MILDTSFLVDLLRGDPKALHRAQELESEGEHLTIPTPVIFELWEGIERSDRPEKERRRVSEVLDGYPLLAFEMAHAARAGEVSGALVRRGDMIDPVDAQIAGASLVEGRPVLTRNARHFERVAGLSVETY